MIATRSFCIASDPDPYANTAAAFVKAGTPVIPAYSLSRFEATTFCSAVFTDGRTYGLPLSSPG